MDGEDTMYSTITATALLAGTLVLLWILARIVFAAGLRLHARSGDLVAIIGGHPRLQSMTQRAARRFPRSVRFVKARFDPTVFRGLPLSLLGAVALYAAALFGGLVEDLFETEGLKEGDQFIFSLVAPLRSDWIVVVFRWITELGSMPTLTAVALISTAFLWAHGRLSYIAPVWLTVAGSQLTTWSGKFLIARPRPDFVLDITVYSPSFPSGHATGAMAVYGIISYVIARDIQGGRARFEFGFWSAALIALVAASRIILGVHYPSDVAAGLLVGLFWTIAGVTLLEWQRSLARSGPETLTRRSGPPPPDSRSP